MRSVAATFALLMTVPLWAQTPDAKSPATGEAHANVMEVDASQPVAPPETGYLHLGGTSSTGQVLSINSRYLMLNGRPMLPVMGEFHYARFPPQYWEEEILKMKAAGVNVVATYIFWIHHEEVEGQFDWSGQRDLRRFVALCGKHGMYVVLRIGPWDHGEVRNGGFPDWLLANKKVRTNDPDYLDHVAQFDRQIGDQVKGLLWKDGGPVIGAQLENEYGQHGAGRGAEHILKLKKIAEASGIDVPIYTVTGWPSLDFPPHEVIPVSGGYPDGFWFDSEKNLPPSVNYLFNLNRKLGDMGATAPMEDPTGKVDLRHDPYFGAEEAGGMAISYRRRPLMRADDIAALTLTGVGLGLNLYGYYMYHGGINPQGKLSTLQESLATGYPNDLPQYNYDFQAPLGEYGQVRESYRKTRVLHLFLNAFGPELAEMVATGPERMPKNAADTSVPRVAVRSQADSGFVFVNNYVRQLEMPARSGFQVHLKLPGGAIDVPERPVTIPANSYLCWPVNLQMGGARLVYSTAQLLTRLSTGNEPTYVFFAVPGVPVAFAFDPETVKMVRLPEGAVVRGMAVRLVHGVAPDPRPLEVTTRDGGRVRVLLLSEAEAEMATVLPGDGGERLVLSGADVFLDGTVLHLRATDRAKLEARFYPAMRTAPASKMAKSTTREGWTEVRFTPKEAKIAWAWKQTRPAGAAPAPRTVQRGGRRPATLLEVPAEEAFANAAEWQIQLKEPLPEGVSDLWMDVDYVGDIARLYVGKTLVNDDFYYGPEWQIGMKRYLPDASRDGVRLEVLPLRRDAKIYLDPAVRAKLPDEAEIAQVKSITMKPEYEETLTIPGGAAATKVR